jgi:hypothetical protein
MKVPSIAMRLATVSIVALAACGGVTPLGGDDAAAGKTGSGDAAGSTGSAGATGTGGTTGSAGVTGAAGVAGHDDCRKDSDCPPIACLVAPCPDSLCALGGDGFHHCQVRLHPTLTACGGNPTGMDCCGSDAACTQQPHGMCVPFTTGYCGGPAPPPINECRYDQCQADGDCTAKPNGVCTTGYPRVCAYGPCRKNADCNKGPGGTCVLASVGSFCPSEAVFCRYPTDPCRQNADCKGTSPYGQVCVPNADGQGTVCRDQSPPPA